MRCGDNCLECNRKNCIIDEANEKHREYQAKWREEHRERHRASQKRWRQANRERVNAKRRMNRLNEKLKSCQCCKADMRGLSNVIKYQNNYFCNKYCLADYLLSNLFSQDRIKTIEIPHNESEVTI